MTEKNFFELFNDIDDKFLTDDINENASLYPVRFSEDLKAPVNRFSWIKPAAAVVGCVVAAGGLFAAGNFLNNSGSYVGTQDTVVTSDEAQAETEVTDNFELFPPTIAFIDGTFGSVDDVWGYDPISSFDPNLTEDMGFYSQQLCYAVPFYTSLDKRTAGQPGDWIKLRKGSRIGDFTVTNAVSYFDYKNNSGSTLPFQVYSSIDLEGELSCTGTVKIDYYHNAEIMLSLDKESCKKLFSLTPYFKNSGDEEDLDKIKSRFENETIYVVLRPGMENYNEIDKAIWESDSPVKVKLCVDRFSLDYDNKGYYYNDMIMLDWRDGAKYSLEIVSDDTTGQ